MTTLFSNTYEKQLVVGLSNRNLQQAQPTLSIPEVYGESGEPGAGFPVSKKNL